MPLSAMEDPAPPKYDLVVVDPPWPNIGLFLTSEHGAYPRMKLPEIAALEIPALLADNSLVLVWTIASFLADTIKIMEGWGLKKVLPVFIWVKTTKGKERVRTIQSSIYYPMRSCEYVLLGRRGKAPRKQDTGVGEVIWAPPREHSRKPDEFWAQLQRWLGDTYPRRLEMFSREPRPGWDTHGNQQAWFQSGEGREVEDE